MIKRQIIIGFLAALSGVVMTSVTHADIYKWTDASGIPHFSDSPPTQGKDIQAVKVKNHPSSDADTSIKKLNQAREDQVQQDKANKADSTKKSQVTAKAGDKADQQPKDSGKYKEKCTQLTNNLKVMNEHGRIREQDSTTGESRYLSDEEKNDRLDQTQREIKAYCQDSGGGQP